MSHSLTTLFHSIFLLDYNNDFIFIINSLTDISIFFGFFFIIFDPIFSFFIFFFVMKKERKTNNWALNAYY